MSAMPASPPLWIAEDALSAMDAGGASASHWSASGVSIDSRTLDAGDLFFAIAGETDGHAYVADALAKGAAAAVVSRQPDGVAADAPLVFVSDTLAALEGLGRAARARTRARICAVTGSVGKTGTKEGLRHILAAQGRTHASAASYNNYLGVPLTLARMPADCEYGIFEIGMNHAGEIEPLSRMVRPDVAIVTTVEAVHIENFRSVEEIADAKGEIFEGLAPGGTAILNRDNRHYSRLASRARACGAGRIVSFGEAEDADARLLRVSLKPEASCASAIICGHEMAFKVGMPGKHVVMNALAMLAAVSALGGDLARAGLALATLVPPAGRGSRSRIETRKGGFLLIDESYNANPASMRAALAALATATPGPRGRRVVVLGDMLELGERAPAEHAALADAVGEADADIVFCAGPLMRHLWNVLPPRRRGGYAETSAELAVRVAEDVAPGDVVMVKGSFGSRMRLVIDALSALAGDAIPRQSRERV